MAERPATFRVPDYDGLPLVGYGDGIGVSLLPAFFYNGADGLQGVRVDFFGVMLDPALFRVILLMRKAGLRQDMALRVEEEGLR